MANIKEQNRRLVDALRTRMGEKAPLIQVVVGPRQVGKTTALKAVLREAGIYHSADYPTPLSSEVLLDWWQEAENDASRLLAVDEIQKV
ncbi:MAG: AAA family ATPase, partial [Deltaproteobacteria bacterium]|nr:AAA family ATPase [Deltaproteobacteria bacterium]